MIDRTDKTTFDRIYDYVDEGKEEAASLILADIFHSYIEATKHRVVLNSTEDFHNLLLKDKQFHQYIKKVFGLILLYRPIDENWMLSSIQEEQNYGLAIDAIGK